MCAGGKVGLIDYGQSKQLPDDARIGFAELIVALDKGDKPVSHTKFRNIGSDRQTWMAQTPEAVKPDT